MAVPAFIWFAWVCVGESWRRREEPIAIRKLNARVDIRDPQTHEAEVLCRNWVEKRALRDCSVWRLRRNG